jgi:hypothetical protein
MHTCLDMTRQFVFENTWTKGAHVSKLMGRVFLFVFNQKNVNDTWCEQCIQCNTIIPQLINSNYI